MSPLCRREGRRRSLALGGGRCQQAWETLLSEDLLELYEASPLGVSELVFFFFFSGVWFQKRTRWSFHVPLVGEVRSLILLHILSYLYLYFFRLEEAHPLEDQGASSSHVISRRERAEGGGSPFGFDICRR